MLFLALLFHLLCVSCKEVIVRLSEAVEKDAPDTTPSFFEMKSATGISFQCHQITDPTLDRNDVIRERLESLKTPLCIYSDFDSSTHYWQYQVCLNHNASQLHFDLPLPRRDPSIRISMGTFEKSFNSDNGDHMYVGGDGGRETRVRFVCGDTDFKLVRVVESSLLRYTMEVSLMALCHNVKQSLDVLPCIERDVEMETGVNMTSKLILKRISHFSVCPGQSVQEVDLVTKRVRKLGTFAHRNTSASPEHRVVEYYHAKYDDDEQCETLSSRVVYQCSKSTFFPTIVSAHYANPCECVIRIKLNVICDTEQETISCVSTPFNNKND